MSFELYLPWNDYFLFAEFLIDDYQVDKKEPGDLEPNEWGINITFGKNNLFKNMDWKINYTRAANRTFNAPVKDYEKYIYKNYPIGHFLGNNFWELKTTLSYKPNTEFYTQMTFYYLETGEEALYGPFNKDFMNYSVKQGYEENFPFGPIKQQSGAVLSTFYSLQDNLQINTQAGYWLSNSRLKKDISFSFGLYYNLNILK
jgi:hypothetical protein